MSSDSCANCGYAAKRKNPDCGDHTTPETTTLRAETPELERFRGQTPALSGEPKLCSCGRTAWDEETGWGNHNASDLSAAQPLPSEAATERPVQPNDKLILTGKEYLEALERSKLEGAREAELRGVAWAIGVVDEMHIGGAGAETTDRLFKGLKNSMRDRCKAITGVDPAPNYPITAKLTAADKGHSA